MSGSSIRAAIAVEDRLFRALAVLRVLTLANALVLNLVRADNFQRPVGGLLCAGIMVAWTAFAIWAYADPPRRGVALLAADLGIAAALLAASPVVKGSGFEASVPGFWVAGALMAWAIRYRWRGGLAAAALLGGVDLVIREDIDQSNYGNVFLLVIGGTIVGFLVESLQQMAAERDEAQRSAAAAAERVRLARVVHDGVLQVLALVQRRGAELGGEAAELGRLAGEQESALRTLVRSQDAVGGAAPAGTADLTGRLAELGARPGVTVATPGRPVVLPSATVAELTAVVSACLDNVERHVGAGAPGWVLLEAFVDRVELTVRDEGPGIPVGRLEQAAADGRLGVSQSIRGRIADLGGTATLTSGPTGTEWEIVVPR